MTASRITESRRRFVEYISLHPVATFTELRNALVLRKEKKKLIQPGMNLATLYRIIEAFKENRLIHEVEVQGERTIVLCQSIHGAEQSGVIIEICARCHSVHDSHFSPKAPVLESLTIQHLATCNACSR